MRNFRSWQDLVRILPRWLAIILRSIHFAKILARCLTWDEPKNAQYTSTTIQNQIFEIAADQFREFDRTCLKNCPHFAIMGDEVTSHGKEILSVCLRLLEVDSLNFSVKPKKHEVLLDFSSVLKG